MIKTKILFGISAVSGLLSFSACSNDDNTVPTSDTTHIPKVVQENFNELFPNATEITWKTTEDGYAVANFNWVASRSTTTNHTAWFTLTDGSWNMTEFEIPFNQLPNSIKTAFQSTEYSKSPWQTDDEVDVLDRNGNTMEKLYVIDVEKTENGIETNADLFYTEEGFLTRVVINAEKDDDYQEFLPQTPSGNIAEYMKEHHPNARIIDIDVEKNGTEVEFIEDNLKHEAFFDKSSNWLYTKTDYDFRMFSDIESLLPPAVITTLKTKLPDGWNVNSIEDVEKYDTKHSGIYYYFEIEKGYKEIKLYISEDGTALDQAPQPGGGSGSEGIPVTGDIEKFLAEKYPGAVVIDKDFEDGYLEIEVLHNNLKKEIRFNGANHWVDTTWEIREAELPEAIKQTLKREGYTLADAEIEVTETPSNPHKLYEMEVRKGDTGDDMDIIIDETGKIVRVDKD